MASRQSAQEPYSAAKLARAPTVDEVPDSELVARARRGDSWAEEALFRKHVDFVSALALRLLRDRTEAEDVVQDTFLAALAGLSTLADPASIRSWLAGIAVHKVHRRFRRRKLLGLLGLAGSSHDVAMSASVRADAPPEVRQALERIDRALDTLDEVDRAAWILRFVEGYRLEEAAAVCRCSLTTLKRRIGRAQAVVERHVDLREDT